MKQKYKICRDFAQGKILIALTPVPTTNTMTCKVFIHYYLNLHKADNCEVCLGDCEQCLYGNGSLCTKCTSTYKLNNIFKDSSEKFYYEN